MSASDGLIIGNQKGFKAFFDKLLKMEANHIVGWVFGSQFANGNF